MRIYGRVAVVGVAMVAVAVYWLWPIPNEVHAQAAASQQQMDDINALEMPFKWEGVASCSTGPCHGGSNPRNTLNGEYSYVMKGIERLGERRGHAYAHLLLRNELSQQMGKYLGIEKPQEAAICLNCHASNPKMEHRGRKFTTGDGVGCESCHGPSEKWIAIHDQANWGAMGDEQKAALGFINTKDVLVRAKVCMGCHVGSELDQDVYHDLIAAGHPRLNFEFSSYHTNMERHWRTSNDLKMHPDLAGRGWIVGQLASAQAAIQLLAHRAAQEKVWPEFAEYDCFACHHDLADPSWRQKRGYPGRKPGSLPWGSWYTSMPMSLVQILEGQASTAAGEKLQALNTLMQSPYPDPKQVSQVAREASAALQTLLVEVNGSRLSREKAAEVFKQLATKATTTAAGSWDAAAQAALGFAAMQECQFDMGGGDESLDSLIDSFFEVINMPRGYNSPRNFQPELIRQEVSKIQNKVSK